MSSRSKRKGTGFEREIVSLAQDRGLRGYRCWGSDGRSRGLERGVDVVLEATDGSTIKLQTKRRLKLPRWLGLSEGVDGVVLRCDRGEAVVVIRLDQYLGLLAPRGSEDGETSRRRCETNIETDSKSAGVEGGRCDG